MILAGLFALSPMAVADNDHALIDVLVERGYLTAEEGRDLAVRPTVRAETKGVKISGYVHTQFNHSTGYDKATGATDPAGGTSFQMRRIFLGAHARLNPLWHGAIMLNLSFPIGNYVDYAWVRRSVEWGAISGQLTAGYSKVAFGFEENTSARLIASVERSMVTRYWSASFEPNGRIGFGARHVGIFWRGRVNEVDGLRYGFSVTNQRANSIGGQDGGAVPQNDLALFANVGWQQKYGAVAVHGGLNFGYKPGGNLVTSTDGERGTITGLNPFLDLKTERFGLMVEGLLSRIDGGRQDTIAAGGSRSRATPIGLNVIATAKMSDPLQAVIRYSHLQTNGRGASPAAILPGAPNPADGRSFDRADSLYVGGNWFIMGNDLKLSAGYEYIWFSDPVRSPMNDSAYAVGMFRARLQALF